MHIPQSEIDAAVKKVLKGEIDVNSLHEALKIEVKIALRVRENLIRAVDEYELEEE